MKAAAVTLLIVATAIINTECFRILDNRQGEVSSNDAESCQSRLVRCSSAIFAHPFLNGSTYNFGTLVPEIDQICQDTVNALGCVQTFIETCPLKLKSEVFLINEVLQYFCSEEGRSLLGAFQQSFCYYNFPEKGTYIETCMDKEREAGPIVANQAFFTRMQDCQARKFIDACGPAFEQITSTLLRIYQV
ncbi:hypothetical protein BsWGS_23319 [Bradybaena similaris]